MRIEGNIQGSVVEESRGHLIWTGQPEMAVLSKLNVKDEKECVMQSKVRNDFLGLHMGSKQKQAGFV